MIVYAIFPCLVHCKTVLKRQSVSWKKDRRASLIFLYQVQYQYPARIAANPQLASYITERLQDNQLLLSVQFDNSKVGANYNNCISSIHISFL